CELGEIVLKDPGTSRPFRCNGDLRNSCPPNYQCRYSSLLTHSVCCGSSATEYCAEGERPYMVSIDESVKECSANVPGSCPAQFLCRFNLQRNKYYCCAPNPESVCKGDAQYIVDDGSKMPRICTPGLFHSCPLGYQCQLPKSQSTSGFCCKVDINAITEGCPPTEYALTNDRKVVECNPFNSTQSCPAGFTCQFAVLFQRYQCCGKNPSDATEIKNR
ncbi:hypothetical protein TELCIR_20405, partial [Teladorsagia circumcincta]